MSRLKIKPRKRKPDKHVRAVLRVICREWLDRHPMPGMVEVMPGQNVDALMNLIECGFFRLVLDDDEDSINVIGHQLMMPSGEVVEEVIYEATPSQ